LEGDFGRAGVRMRPPRLILFWFTLAITVSAAPAAHAHLMNTGFGPFDDGLTNLFMTPEDLLPVIALALLAGLRGPSFGRAILFALPVAWLLGSAAGLLFVPPRALTVVATTVTIALGALLAADSPLPLAAVAALAILLGLLHGVLNGSELPRTHRPVRFSPLALPLRSLSWSRCWPDRPPRCGSRGRVSPSGLLGVGSWPSAS
jgi:hydrogenase/urease accessory protein HupE